MNKLLKEAIFIGASTAIMGTFLSYLAMAYSRRSFTFKFDHWTTVIISEFLSGFILHYLWEHYGLNKWYCDNGNACQ